jgi:hypothetical protein
MPTIRLLDNLNANGSEGSAIRSHSCAISAVRTERFGSFLNVDLEPNVAASLLHHKEGLKRFRDGCGEGEGAYYQRSPKPLSLRASSSDEKNIISTSNVVSLDGKA